MKFQLTFKYKSSPDVVVTKEFKGKTHNRRWANARRWQSRCEQIHGYSISGEIVNEVILETIPESI